MATCGPVQVHALFQAADQPCTTVVASLLPRSGDRLRRAGNLHCREVPHTNSPAEQKCELRSRGFTVFNGKCQNPFVDCVASLAVPVGAEVTPTSTRVRCLEGSGNGHSSQVCHCFIGCLNYLKFLIGYGVGYLTRACTCCPRSFFGFSSLGCA